jgi:hypothetical protein
VSLRLIFILVSKLGGRGELKAGRLQRWVLVCEKVWGLVSVAKQSPRSAPSLFRGDRLIHLILKGEDLLDQGVKIAGLVKRHHANREKQVPRFGQKRFTHPVRVLLAFASGILRKRSGAKPQPIQHDADAVQ